MWITLTNIVLMDTAWTTFFGFLRELGTTVIFNMGLEGDLSSSEECLDGVLLADIVVTLCSFTSSISLRRFRITTKSVISKKVSFLGEGT